MPSEGVDHSGRSDPRSTSDELPDELAGLARQLENDANRLAAQFCDHHRPQQDTGPACAGINVATSETQVTRLAHWPGLASLGLGVVVLIALLVCLPALVVFQGRGLDAGRRGRV